MTRNWIAAVRVAALLLVGLFAIHPAAFAQVVKPKTVHDAEYYVLEAQHGQKWATEDKGLDAKLAELKQP